MLFTFPSRYLFTIGQNVYLALPDSPGGFLQDFTSPVVLKNNYSSGMDSFHLQGFHLLWRCFPTTSTMNHTSNTTCLWKQTTQSSYNTLMATTSIFHYRLCLNRSPSTHNSFTHQGLGSSLFARRYSGNALVFRSRSTFACITRTRNEHSFSFPLGTEMFHFPRCPPRTYLFSTR